MNYDLTDRDVEWILWALNSKCHELEDDDDQYWNRKRLMEATERLEVQFHGTKDAQ